MSAGPGRGGERTAAAGGFDRLICVCPNPSIDKIAAVDRLTPGEIHRPELLSVLPGGKAVNVARAAAALGLRVSVVAVLAGHAGDWLAEGLASRDIPVCAVAVPGETRTCFSVLDRETGSLTEFYESGVTLDADGWERLETTLAAEIERDPPRPLVAISGSLPRGGPADGYRRLAALGASTGARVALDVGGPQLAAALDTRPWMVKVNVSEAADALGLPATGESAASRAVVALRDAGASIAVVTQGVRGAIVGAAGGMWRIGPSPEHGPFAVGSGDTFLAGFLAGLHGGADVPAAARQAAAVAAAQALVPGQGEFRAADVARVAASVTVERVR